MLTAVLDEHAAEARRRADRAAVRAADRQPDVRRTRSLRAGRGVARQGHRADGARPARPAPIASPRPAAAARRRRPRSTGEVLRVDRFGNLITNIDRKTFEQARRRRRSTSSVGAHQVSQGRLDLRRRAAGRGLRALRQHRSPRDRRQRRERRRAARSRPRRRRARRPPRVIRFRVRCRERSCVSLAADLPSNPP